jgi:hypothetical protein
MTCLSAFEALSSLTSVLADFWSNSLFQRETWAQLTKGLRLLLAAVGALALIYEVRARRLGSPISERTRQRFAWTMTLLAFGVYFEFFNPNVHNPGYYHRHEIYHYYTGSKYFDELGYKRLYECSLLAEAETRGRKPAATREVRDLKTNALKPLSAIGILDQPERCKRHFTPARWQAFTADIDWFVRNSDRGYWEGMQRDHGYNPPPVWTLVGGAIASMSPASDGFLKTLASIDVLLHVGIALLFNWAFGVRVMATAVVFWGANAPADYAWTGGAFLRQDWLFLLVLSQCCLRRRRFALAGAALAWAALIRVFPAIFAIGAVIPIALYLLRRLRSGENAPQRLLDYLHQDHRRFLTGAALAVAILVPTSLFRYGGDAYREFAAHTLGTHQSTPLTNHMGLQTQLVHDWSGRLRFAREDALGDAFDAWKRGRIERFQQRKPLLVAITVFVLAWTIWALRRTRLLWVGFALSLPLVMCLTNLTCYYYSMFLLAAVLVAARPQLGAPLLVASGIGKALQHDPEGFYWLDDRWTAQSWLYFVLALTSPIPARSAGCGCARGGRGSLRDHRISSQSPPAWLLEAPEIARIRIVGGSP